ncbi:MAG: hypothetical protein U0M06_07965 [Clostridia bacterium]|nr:hypothetical protein [Clostridia bacterium]
MKKFLVVLLALVLALALVACGEDKEGKETDTDAVTTEATETGDDSGADTTDEAASNVMTYAEFAAAELESAVVVETYVQAKQSWWDNKAIFYTQNEDGAYLLYNMACSEEEYGQLVPGTKIRVSGVKTEWQGEVEIVDATYEIIAGETFIAEPVDLTAVLATEELINYQNQLASFKGLTVEKVEYKNGEPGDDIYVTFGLDGASYSFCVEYYLTGSDTEVYKAVGELEVGDVVDVEGFVYWYQGVNTHITAITVAE